MAVRLGALAEPGGEHPPVWLLPVFCLPAQGEITAVGIGTAFAGTRCDRITEPEQAEGCSARFC